MWKKLYMNSDFSNSKAHVENHWEMKDVFSIFRNLPGKHMATSEFTSLSPHFPLMKNPGRGGTKEVG